MSRDPFPGRAARVHPQAWLWEPLEEDPSFLLRPMFGSRAAYVRGRMVLCFCARDEPWRGVLICTAREHHASLRADFPEAAPHAILPKWLYLPEAHPRFEPAAERAVRLVRQGDPRIGVVPQPRGRRGRRR